MLIPTLRGGIVVAPHSQRIVGSPSRDRATVGPNSAGSVLPQLSCDIHQLGTSGHHPAGRQRAGLPAQRHRSGPPSSTIEGEVIWQPNKSMLILFFGALMDWTVLS